MTHTELLESLNYQLKAAIWDFETNNAGWIEGVQALIAVVELHKPFMCDGRMGKYQRCSFCKTEEEWLGEIYPCQTIQTIEGKLK